MLHNETDKAPKTWRFIGWLGMDEELGMGYYMDGFTEDDPFPVFPFHPF